MKAAVYLLSDSVRSVITSVIWSTVRHSCGLHTNNRPPSTRRDGTGRLSSGTTRPRHSTLSPVRVDVEAARPRWLISRFRQISVRWSAHSGDGQSASGASSCYIRPGDYSACAAGCAACRAVRPPENEPVSHTPYLSLFGPLTFIAHNTHKVWGTLRILCFKTFS